VKDTLSARHEEWTGVGNEQILDNLERVRRITHTTGAAMRVRVPLIGGINDADADADRLARLLLTLEPPPPVDLLPYQPFGNSKYERLGRPVPGWLAAPSGDRQAEFAGVLSGAGLQVTIRGEPHEFV